MSNDGYEIQEKEELNSMIIESARCEYCDFLVRYVEHFEDWEPTGFQYALDTHYCEGRPEPVQEDKVILTDTEMIQSDDIKKYKIVSSTDISYNDMEIPFPYKNEIGSHVHIFGKTFTVIQPGSIIVISNEKWNITLQEIPKEPKESIIPSIINDTKYLRMGYEIDISFDAKEIIINIGEYNLLDCEGIEYHTLYTLLKNEWVAISKNHPEHHTFIMEHPDGTNNYCFLNSWGFKSGMENTYTVFLKDGCWSRKNRLGGYI